jgi:isoquinoline 1-oxidoreductase beta subunit
MTHHDIHLSRRAVLKGVAGLVIGVCLPGAASAQSGAARIGVGERSATAFAPNAFVRVGTDTP